MKEKSMGVEDNVKFSYTYQNFKPWMQFISHYGISHIRRGSGQ
jgi:hypothetical protein